MKVSIICGNYYNSKNGIGRYTQNLIRIFDINNNINLNIMSNQNIKNVSSNAKNSKKLKRTPNKLKLLIQKILFPIEIEVNYFKRFIIDTHNNNLFVDNTQSNIYHAVSPSEAVLALKYNKRPLITTIHDLIPLITRRRFLFEKYYFKKYMKSAVLSDLIVTDSINTKNDIVKYMKVSSDRIRVIYPYINLEKFKFKPKTSNNIYNILYLGGLVERKGIFETILSIEKLLKLRNDIKLTIVGQGEEEINAKKLINKLKINKYVKVLGYVDEGQLPDIYYSADVFVYPSKYEGFGYTPLEAMACGIPIVASNTSSIPEVLGDAAILIDPNDANAIAEAIDLLLNNNNLRKELIKKGLSNAKKYSYKRFSKEMLDVYNSF